MSSDPVATIIIPAYNSARYLPEAIESALAQSHVPMEVIVVNDGSTDETEFVLDSYRSRCRCVRQANQGVSAARNTGLEMAAGRFVLFLDADDSLSAGALTSLAAAATSTTEECVAYGDVMWVREATGVSGLFRKPDFAGLPPHAAQQMFARGGIPPSAFLVQRRLAHRVGGFDRKFSYAADLHFFLRCGCLARFVHVPHVVLRYRQHEHNMSRNQRTAVRDNVDARMAFQSWCAEQGVDPQITARSETDLIGDWTEHSFYTRDWHAVDACLELASTRQVVSPRIDRIRRLRRFPHWVFALKDGLDNFRT